MRLSCGVLVLLLAGALGVGCQRNEAQLAIGEAKLSQVLLDLHYAEVAVEDKPSPLRDSLLKSYEKEIFAHYQISKSDFEKSIRALRQHPTQLIRIYRGIGEKVKPAPPTEPK